MQTITTVNELKIAIKQMESIRDMELILLKSQVQLTVDSLKPANLIKATLKKMVTGSGIKTSILNTVMGITSGIVAEKVVVGKSHNPITKVMGTLIKYLVTNKVVKNADDIKVIGTMIYNKISKKNDKNIES